MLGKCRVLHYVFFFVLLLSTLSLPNYAQAQSIEKPNTLASRIVVTPTDAGVTTQVYWTGNLSDQTVATFNGQQVVMPGPNAIVDLIVVLQQEPLAVMQGQWQGQTITAAGAQQLAQQAALINSQQQQVLQSFAANGLSAKITQRYQYLLNALAVSAPMGRLPDIAATPGVKGVYFDYRTTLALNESVPQIGAPAVWAQTDSQGRAIRGEGVRVAIIDSGIDYTHPDLGGCFGINCRVIGGYDFVNNDADPMDDNSHGTHVAGIVAANGTLKGVAPAAKLLAYKVCDAGGSCQYSNVIAALERAANPDGNPATNDAVDVINMSLGGPGNANDPLSTAANQAVAQGIVVVAAAGNSGAYRTVGSPGAAAQVLTVGAVSKSDVLAAFSSKGWAGDYIVKPEITAPGVAIRSSVPNGGYAVYSGTSMASPHVAGAAALVKQAHPTWTPAQIKSALVNTALDLGLDPYAQGNGRLRVDQALNPTLRLTPGVLSFGLVDSGQPLWRRSQTFAVTNLSNTTQSYTLTVAAGLAAGLNVTLSATQLTLAPQQRAPVTITLAVDNNVLPFLTADPYSYAGAVLVQDGTQQRRVPFTVVKTSVLQLNLAEGVALITVYDRGLNRRAWYLSAEAQPDPLHPVVLLPPGDYDLFVAYVNRKLFVVKENLAVTNRTVVNLPLSDAKNRLITRLRHFDNQIETVALHHDIVFKHKASNYWLGISSTGLPGAEVRISNLSNAYYYEMCSYLRAYPAQPVAYDLCINGEQGITQSQTQTLVAANLKKLVYRIEPEPGMTQVLPLPFFTYGPGWGDASIWYFDSDWQGAPFERTIYYTPLTSPYARGRVIGAKQRAANKVEAPIVSTTPGLTFPTKATVQTRYGNFEPATGWLMENATLTNERWPFANAPVYWAGHFANSAEQVRIDPNGQTGPTYDFNTGLYNYPFLRDQLQTMTTGRPITYTLTTVAGATSGALTHSNTLPTTAGPATLALSYNYPFRGGTAAGQVIADFDTSRTDKDPPTLLAVQLVGADGPNPETLTGAGKVVVRVKDNVAVSQITLALRFGDQSWRTLVTTQANDTYTGTIPAFSGLSVTPAALRIEAVDSSGNRIRNEITPAFIAQTTGLSGRVTDANGAPLGAVTVSAYRPSGSAWVKAATALSNATGDYRIANRPPGVYRLGFTKSGYQAQFYSNSSTITAATNVTVTAGAETSNINASLSAGTAAVFDPIALHTTSSEGRFVIQGQVVDAQSGTPLPNATVTLYVAPDWQQDESVAENGTTTCGSLTEPLPAADMTGAMVEEGESSAVGMSTPVTPLVLAPDQAPQTTDANGWYGWPVGQGCWYVIVSADGYYPVRSVPLPATELTTLPVIALPPQHQLFLPILAR